MTVAGLDLFEAIRGTANSRLENQKQAFVILKAAEDTLTEKAMALSAESYFVVLFPLLDDERREKALGNEDRIIELNSSIMYLLSFVFPHLSAEFIQTQYPSMYSTLSHSMVRFKLIAPFIRSAIVCLKTILEAHIESDWFDDKSSLGELFALLLSFMTDERPKIRKVAQEVVTSLVHKRADVHAMVCELISSFCLNSTRKHADDAIHVMPMLKSCLPSFETSEASISSCNNIVAGIQHSLQLGNNSLILCLFQQLDLYCRTLIDSSDGNIDKSNGPMYGVLKRLLDCIWKFSPATGHVEIVSGHILLQSLVSVVVCKIQLSLGKFEAFQETSKRAFSTLRPYLNNLGSDDGCMLSAVSGYGILFASVFGQDKFKIDPEVLAESINMIDTVLPSISNLKQNASGERIMDNILPLVAGMLEVLGENITCPAGSSLLEHLARLHDCRQLKSRDKLLKCFGVAIRSAGMDTFLSVLPLNLPKGPNPRAWLIPVLESSVFNTSLETFATSLLPILPEIESRAAALDVESKRSESRAFEILKTQVLSILPAVISSFPLDFAQVFPKLAELIGSILNDNPVLRSAMATSLTRFVHNCLLITGGSFKSFNLDDDADEDEPTIEIQAPINEVNLIRPLSVLQAQQDLEVLKGYVPQLLPILFNVYAAEALAGSTANYLLNPIETLLQLTPTTAIQEYFHRTVERIIASMSNHTVSMFLTVLELAGCMSKVASVQFCLEDFVSLVKNLSSSLSVESLDHAIQKRVYRLLLTIWKREDVSLALINLDNGAFFEAFVSALETSLPYTHAGSKKIRFRLMSVLASSWPDQCLGAIATLIPEIVMGSKESNSETRAAAFELLISFGRRMSLGGDFKLNGSSEIRSASLSEYLNMVLAGLAGNSSLIVSATIMALARIVFEFSNTLNSQENAAGENLMALIASDIISLLDTPNREIIKSAISFVKVLISLCGASPLLQQLLPNIVRNLINGAGHPRHHNHFKRQIRYLLARLIRKFGLESIKQTMPIDHLPLLSHIKKEQERQARKVSKADPADQDNGANPSLLSSSKRFEKTVLEEEDDPEEFSNLSEEDDIESKTAKSPEKALSLALSKQLSLASVGHRTRLPNVSRKQQALLVKEIAQINMAKSQKRSRDEAETGSEDDGLDVEYDGRLIVKQRAATNGEEIENMNKFYRAAQNSFKRSVDGKHVKFARGKKAIQFEEADDHDGMDDPASGNVSVAATGLTRRSAVSSLTRKSTAATLVKGIHSGEQYRPTKKNARGDAKRNGAKYDPYAYVPIQRKQGRTKENYFMGKKPKNN